MDFAISNGTVIRKTAGGRWFMVYREGKMDDVVAEGCRRLVDFAQGVRASATTCPSASAQRH